MRVKRLFTKNKSSPYEGKKLNVRRMSYNALIVLTKRYLKKDEKGNVIESPFEMYWRVAKNIAQSELSYYPKADVKEYAEKFFNVMARLDFMPNSPTLMNAGSKLQQLSACFVLPINDSIESIFEALKYAALIHKSGGGTGFSFSRIRPSNDLVSTSNGRASGPISFMKVFNAATESIKQGGRRRGANMGVLRCNHPDILDWIKAKSEQNELNNFNISVAITDSFMDALESGSDYDLVNPRTGKAIGVLNTKEVFDAIVQKAWEHGEPGIVFIDRMNRDNLTPQLGEIESTNPCGEQPLLPYESCNLGSINLSNIVEHGQINYLHLKDTVHISIRFLDNAIDMNRFPIDHIEHMTKSNRKIGLGIMGFADMLIKLGIPYASEKALNIAGKIMHFVDVESKKMSQELAMERGPFPNFDKSRLSKEACPPIRNATTTTIAPTGTISIICNCSSGIEPVYAVSYTRNVLDGEKLIEAHPLFEKKAREMGFYSDELMKKISERGSVQEIEEVPAQIKRLFQNAHEISPEWHIRMQAAFQAHTDNAVSKTVNLPHDATVEDVEKAYSLAYKLGCKGVTVYRDGSRNSQALFIEREDIQEKESIHKTKDPVYKIKTRPDVIHGSTRRIRTGCGNLYITINEGPNGKPFEVFSIMGKSGGCAASQTEAICRLISFIMRCGVDIAPIVKHLKGISCHSTTWGQGGRILSCADAIAKAIELHLDPHTVKQENVDMKNSVSTSVVLIKGACPECGGIVDHEGGCVVCRACGFSECG